MRHIKKFKIFSDKTPQVYFWVYVYENLDQLRDQASRFNPNENYDDCYGVCQPFKREIVKETGEIIRHPNIGVIRILDKAGAEVSLHEIIHASLWNYRVCFGDANFGEECSIDEENFAYICGQLYRSLVSKMYKFGIWK